MRKPLLAAPAAAMLILAATTSTLIQIVARTSPRLSRHTEVEAVEAFDRWEPRCLDPALDHPPLAVDQLQLRQASEKADMIQAFGRALAGELLALAQEGRQLQRLELMGKQDLRARRSRRTPRHQTRAAGRRRPCGPGHMGILLNALGHEPIVRLQTGGLKAAEVVLRGGDPSWESVAELL